MNAHSKTKRVEITAHDNDALIDMVSSELANGQYFGIGRATFTSDTSAVVEHGSFATGDDAYDLARRILRHERQYDEYDVQAAIDVLACSSEPADIQTVRLLRHRAWAVDGGEFPQDWPETVNSTDADADKRTATRLRLIGYGLIFIAAIALAVLAERTWTEANATAIERIV